MDDKGKGKVILVLNPLSTTHEGILGSGGTAPPFLISALYWRGVVRFMSQMLHPQGKCPLYPLDKRLGETELV
jgi:hypothetical protein